MGRLFRPWTEHPSTRDSDATMSSGHAPVATQDCTISTTSQVRPHRNRKSPRRDTVFPVPLAYDATSAFALPPLGPWSYAPEVTCCAEAAMLEEYGRLLHEAELQQQLLKSRKQRPKKFRCPHCQVAFSNNGQLKGHVRIHTGGSMSLYVSSLQRDATRYGQC
jgi:huckebein